MKKLSSKALSLNVSTLRVLTETTMRGVVGGDLETKNCLHPRTYGCPIENGFIVTVFQPSRLVSDWAVAEQASF